MKTATLFGAGIVSCLVFSVDLLNSLAETGCPTSSPSITRLPPSSVVTGKPGKSVAEAIKEEEQRRKDYPPKRSQPQYRIVERPIMLEIRVDPCFEVTTPDINCATAIYDALAKHAIVPLKDVSDSHCGSSMHRALDYQRAHRGSSFL